jgi:hypothetical protein
MIRRIHHIVALSTVAAFAASFSAACSSSDVGSSNRDSVVGTAVPNQGDLGSGTNTPAQAAACGASTYIGITDPNDDFYVPPGNLMPVTAGEVLGRPPVAIQGNGESVCGFAAVRNAILASGGPALNDQDLINMGLTTTTLNVPGTQLNGQSVGVEFPVGCDFLSSNYPGTGWSKSVLNYSDSNLAANIYNTVAQGGVVATVISWNDNQWNQWDMHWIVIDGVKEDSNGDTWYLVRTWGCYVWMKESYLLQRMNAVVYTGRPFCVSNLNVQPNPNGPLPGFTAATNYSGDLWCCCDSSVGPRAINFSVDPANWSVMPEHQCLDNGHNFRPGTCGVPTNANFSAQRQAANLPMNGADCANFQANAGNGWGNPQPAPLPVPNPNPVPAQ